MKKVKFYHTNNLMSIRDEPKGPEGFLSNILQHDFKNFLEITAEQIIDIKYASVPAPEKYTSMDIDTIDSILVTYWVEE